MSDRGAVLAKFARAKVREALGGERAVRPDAAWCAEPGAVFVTLRRRGRLHGCIGSLEPTRAIVDDVGHNAIAAATRDPRATPIVLDDVDDLDLEVSILSPLEPVELAAVRPGKDGIVMIHRDKRATFLPVMWETFSDVTTFMAALRHKAGFVATSEIRLMRYTVEHHFDPAPK